MELQLKVYSVKKVRVCADFTTKRAHLCWFSNELMFADFSFFNCRYFTFSTWQYGSLMRNDDKCNYNLKRHYFFAACASWCDNYALPKMWGMCVSFLKQHYAHLHTISPPFNSDSVQHSLHSTSNVSCGHWAHDSTSTQFGLSAILTSGVQPAEKSLEPRGLHQSSTARPVFYFEILEKLLGMNVAKNLRNYR